MTTGDKRIRAAHVLAHAYYHLEETITSENIQDKNFWSRREAQTLIMRKFYHALAMPMCAFQKDAPSYMED